MDRGAAVLVVAGAAAVAVCCIAYAKSNASFRSRKRFLVLFGSGIDKRGISAASQKKFG